MLWSINFLIFELDHVYGLDIRFITNLDIVNILYIQRIYILDWIQYVVRSNLDIVVDMPI